MDLVIELRTLHSEQPIQRELQAMPNLESTNKKDSVQIKVTEPIMIMEASEHLYCKHRKKKLRKHVDLSVCCGHILDGTSVCHLEVIIYIHYLCKK